MSLYTCFKYKNYSPDKLHCTHKYFGELSNQELAEVIKIINDYFLLNKVKSFSPVFNVEDFFGKNKEFRVIKTEQSINDFLLELRDKLNQFKKDNYPSYQPHVTTKYLSYIDYPFYSYALVQNGKVIQEWILN